MTTKSTGNRITGLLALTFEADYAAVQGDHVFVSDDYTVSLCTGAERPIGYVSVANVKRTGPAYPTPDVPGDCTVEVPGFAVVQGVSSAAVAAGDAVGISADGKRVVTVADKNAVNYVGTALTSTTGANQKLDFLQQS